MNLIIAFSTTNGKTLADSHFGDADSYPVYKISKENVELIKIVNNSTEENEEEIHGDPRKAKSITQILKPHKVQILCGKQFGKNIIRMVNKFVPVLVDVNSTDEAILLIQKNFEIIKEQWEKGEGRKHIRLKN